MVVKHWENEEEKRYDFAVLAKFSMFKSLVVWAANRQIANDYICLPFARLSMLFQGPRMQWYAT